MDYYDISHNNYSYKIMNTIEYCGWKATSIIKRLKL